MLDFVIYIVVWSNGGILLNFLVSESSYHFLFKLGVGVENDPEVFYVVNLLQSFFKCKSGHFKFTASRKIIAEFNPQTPMIVGILLDTGTNHLLTIHDSNFV